jgi:hypothetical protein
MQEGLEELEAEMSRIKATLDENTKEVEQAKRAASKAAKALEQAEKEISLRVRGYFSKHIRSAIACWSDDKLRDRMMKLRGWESSARAYTANAASRRLSYRWSLEI